MQEIKSVGIIGELEIAAFSSQTPLDLTSFSIDGIDGVDSGGGQKVVLSGTET